MKLYEYAVRRLLLMVLVLFGISVIIFYLLRGDLPPESALAPFIAPRMNDAEKLSIAQSLGVANLSCPSWGAFSSHQTGCIAPVTTEYFLWLKNVMIGNWGYSLLPGYGGTDRTYDIFASRFVYTAELAILGAILTIVVGIPLGIISATHNNRAPDHISRMISLGGYSVPQYWFGYLLQIVFVLYIVVNGSGLFPSSGTLATTCGICVSDPGRIGNYTGVPLLDSLLSGNLAYFWDALLALALPSITLAITSIGALTRIVRSSMLEVLRQDYILLAKSKGLRNRIVTYRHALRNALLPAVTVSGLLVAGLLGGVIIIEFVFGLPGVGATSIVAIENADVNFLELYVLVTALIVVVTNLVVDIIYAKLDPRIRY